MSLAFVSASCLQVVPANAAATHLDPDTGMPIPSTDLFHVGDPIYPIVLDAVERDHAAIAFARTPQQPIELDVTRTTSVTSAVLGDVVTFRVELRGQQGDSFSSVEDLTDVLSHNANSTLLGFAWESGDTVGPSLLLNNNSLVASGVIGASGTSAFTYEVLLDVEADGSVVSETCGTATRTNPMRYTRSPFRDLFDQGEQIVYFQGGPTVWPADVEQFYTDWSGTRVGPEICANSSITLGDAEDPTVPPVDEVPPVPPVDEVPPVPPTSEVPKQTP